jgi:hypothetical protein
MSVVFCRLGAVNACMRLPGYRHLAYILRWRDSIIIQAAQANTSLDERMVVMVLRIFSERSSRSDPQARRHFCSYLKPFQFSTESLPIAPDSNHVVFSWPFIHPLFVPVCCRWQTRLLGPPPRPHGSDHEHASCDVGQSYSTAITRSKCCLLVGHDNRSKQALPARSHFDYTIDWVDESFWTA